MKVAPFTVVYGIVSNKVIVGFGCMSNRVIEGHRVYQSSAPHKVAQSVIVTILTNGCLIFPDCLKSVMDEK